MQLRSFKLVQEHNKLAGVCGGLAYWLGLPSSLIRVLFVLLLFAGSLSFWFYLVAWIITPEWDKDPQDYESVCE